MTVPHRPSRSRRGSVLVPAVAAMLILSLCGMALSELFAAQRAQSMLTTDSARAHWIAEAGAYHAAHAGLEIASPVAFAGGTYTVTKTGDTYDAEGRYASALRTFSLTHVPGTAGPGPTSPLDEAASSATAALVHNRRFEVDLVSVVPHDVEIATFDLGASVPTTAVRELELDGARIWRQSAGAALPTGPLALNEGTSAERTVVGGGAPVLQVEFRSQPSGSIQYSLDLAFTDGSSSSLAFQIDW